MEKQKGKENTFSSNLLYKCDIFQLFNYIKYVVVERILKSIFNGITDRIIMNEKKIENDV